MKDTLKLIAIALVAGLVSGIIVALVGGGNQSELITGATGTRFTNGISTNSTSPASGEIRTNYLTTDGATGVATSTFTSSGYSIGGVDYYDISGSFDDASTTLKSILNPFRATSTVMVANLEVTGQASTSLTFYVATSTTGQFDGGNLLGCSVTRDITSCEGSIIDEAIVASTTDCTINGTGCNGSYSTILGDGTQLLNFSILGSGTGSSHQKLVVAPNEYVMIVATTTYNDEAIITTATTDATSDGFTNTGNTFTGNYFLKFIKP